jgi:tetratricopeptide (TPR) repeat protein
MRTSISIFATGLLLCSVCTAFGAGGGETPRPSMGDSGSSKEIPREELLRMRYNAAVRAVEKADDIGADAARQSDPGKRAKLSAKAKAAYTTAREKFLKVVEVDRGMHEAWNYLGYTSRQMGDYEGALMSYDRALSLKPGYPEAIEYRAHAYLGLSRLSEAKEAYLTLFAGNRKLAAQLLTAMKAWVVEHREKPAGIDAVMLESFASWVGERSAIAGQTASLTREGASAAW